MSVCFLLTHIPDPRTNKRIEVFKGITDVHVICARRASQDIYEPMQDVEHTILEIDLPSARYLAKRYLKSRQFQRAAMRKINEIRPTTIYAEGLDTLLLAVDYSKKHSVQILFEVADLRENYISKPKRLINRVITEILLEQERKAFKSVDYLIITSPKFFDYHYKDLIKLEKTIYIPNAPDIAAFKDYHKKTGGEFTVGFIGGIRYITQMKLLVDSSKKAGVNVLFAGAGGTSEDYNQIKEYCEGKLHVQFTGKYNYNTQIAKLYGMVNCVYAVYDADNPNVRIALPNKLYESIICELPIIVAKGTFLEELVNEWGVGISVNHNDPTELTGCLERLSTDPDYYNGFVRACVLKKKDLMEESKSILKLREIIE